MHRYGLPNGFTDPHLGRHLELMLSGAKNIAMFERVPLDFEPFVTQNILRVFVKDRFSHVIYRPDSEAEMHQFCDLVEMARLNGFDHEIERKIAVLLGYSTKDIDIYLDCSDKMFAQMAQNQPPTPKGVAPHEGRELLLMLEGIKHVALFEFIPKEFEPYLVNGVFESMIHDTYANIVYHPDFKTQAEQLSEVLHQTHGKMTIHFEREIGRLLDYKHEDIEAYIRHIQPFLDKA